MNKLSPGLIKAINLFTTISCFVVIVLIITWIYVADQSSINLIIKYVVLQVFLIILIWLFHSKFINLKLSLLSFNAVYLFGELFLILFSAITGQPLTNTTNIQSSGFLISEKLFEGDDIRGYKLVAPENKCRNFKLTYNTVEYDVVININNSGVNSHFDYSYTKPDSIKRYIVFGDSFSAGLFMDTSWVDKIHADLKQKNVPIELYNFSIDGGGIMNWYSTLCNEIIPNYQFDGIILMSYLDNLRKRMGLW